MTEKPSHNIKRNFPGIQENQYYSLEDLKSKFTSGTTDTDASTDTSDNYKGYSESYKTKGKPHGHGGQVLGTTPKKDKNTHG